MPVYEASVPVYFARFYLVSYPQKLEDDPRLKWGPEGELAVSASDGLGLNSITSEHHAHVTLDVFDSADDVPPQLRKREPRYWFTSSSGTIAIVDTEGQPALECPAPGVGRLACVVTCEGREATYNARHHEQRGDIRDVERWRIAIWPQPE